MVAHSQILRGVTEMEHVKFHYNNLSQIREEEKKMGVRLPLSEKTEVLHRPTSGAVRLENRFAIQPMEGCDAAEDGGPGELTLRRYTRFAKSGAGLIWGEAVAMEAEARAKPRQLQITENNLDSFKAMIHTIKETSFRTHGFEPVVILQAAHSGRYANPNGGPDPIIAYQNPLFEKDRPLDQSRIITDDELERLEEAYGRTARLAQEAGFDGVDIKACHRYLCSELLSAYTRPGKYGGSFENRTRLLRNGILSAQASVKGSFLVTSRLNVYDGFPYPYGFGVSPDGGITPDLTEPLMLVGQLHRDLGLKMINITIGNPYVNPHVNRPYDKGNYVPEEHPFEGLARMMHCVGQVQRSNPGLLVVGSAFSYLRQFSVYMAAGAVEQGICQVVGFGRQAFAYPEFIEDLKKNGSLNEKKCCVSCGACAKLLRAGECAGCVVRDSAVYQPVRG